MGLASVGAMSSLRRLRAVGGRLSSHGAARQAACGVVVVVSLLVLPQPYVFPVLLAVMFVAGWLSPDHPVAAATAVAAVFLLPCSVILALIGASWFPSGWEAFYPVRFGYPIRFEPFPATWTMVGDLVVGILYTWGWAVGASYMGAGIALRLRNRAAVA